MPPTWLDVEFILMVHEEQINVHGGSQGVLNGAALDATAMRPRQVLHHEPGATIFFLAAALGHGFAKNHCFSDGNKRISLIATETFLLLNGWEVEAPEEQKVVVYEQLAAGDMSEAAQAVSRRPKGNDSGYCFDDNFAITNLGKVICRRRAVFREGISSSTHRQALQGPLCWARG